ncbi:MAG: twin-arginine translocase subunit TatC [Chlorobiales bacterium]|nr:twin-arginine translocase subunit TatC [Chlorobiales bacterium]
MIEENESIPSPQLPEGGGNIGADDAAIQKTQTPVEIVMPYAPVEHDSEDESTLDTTESEPEGGMNFMAHLEEIRSRLIKSVIALVLVTGVCTMYSDFLVNEVLIGPLTRSSKNIVLQNLIPYGQLSLYLQVVVFSAFIISFPFLAWQIWQFIAPGLHENERKAGRFSILFISLSFFTGIGFGYFVFLPVTLQFFASFGSTLIKNNISVQDYVSFFIGALLTAGLVFELPFIAYILSKIGLLTPAFMRFYRKHAIVFLLVVAAIVTPSTDIVTQLVIGLPMILLYELSILISAHVNRKNNALKI